MSVELVAVRGSAAAALSTMQCACFPDDPWDAPALARILALSGVFGCLARQDGEAAGFVLARDLGDEVEILSLATLPERRRQGVGRALVDAVVGEAQRRGRHSVVLEVAVDNCAARRLYAGRDFVQVGRRRGYYRRPGGLADGLIMRRRIAGDATVD